MRTSLTVWLTDEPEMKRVKLLGSKRSYVFLKRHFLAALYQLSGVHHFR